MKYILILILTLILSACFDNEPKTVYDYFQNEHLLKENLNKCISGEIKSSEKCDLVKNAYNKLDYFKSGLYSEDDLKSLGKK